MTAPVSAPFLQSDMAPTDDGRVLLQVKNLSQEFTLKTKGVRSQRFFAVHDVSFEIRRGEVLAIVGESGCGKSTMARGVLQMPRPTDGEVLFRGRNLATLRGKELQEAMRGIQVVFQDPFVSLDPRKRVVDLVAEPLDLQGIESKELRESRVEEVLASVGLDISIHGRRRPRELSGGQCQRIAIARAIIAAPSLVICDEPVASLDVSVQAQILNIFENLRTDLDLSYLFITHNLAVAHHLGDRIAVIYLGRFCEVGDSEGVYRSPLHPYSAALLSSAPGADRVTERIRLLGDPASAVKPPSGCRFHTRCPSAEAICSSVEPQLEELLPGRWVACHYPLATEGATSISIRAKSDLEREDPLTQSTVESVIPETLK